MILFDEWYLNYIECYTYQIEAEIASFSTVYWSLILMHFILYVEPYIYTLYIWWISFLFLYFYIFGILLQRTVMRCPKMLKMHWWIIQYFSRMLKMHGDIFNIFARMLKMHVDICDIFSRMLKMHGDIINIFARMLKMHGDISDIFSRMLKMHDKQFVILSINKCHKRIEIYLN